MSSFTPIDLSKLSAPDIVEKLDYKEILTQLINRLRTIDPSFTALVESDPAIKILEVVAYLGMLLRQRVNDSARGVMLAFATGSDLEHLGALFGVTRKVIRNENLQALPPIEKVLESDHDFRYRITLALEGLSTAGPEGSYLYHVLKYPGVKDASIVGPPTVSPGQVLVTILGHNGDGSVGEEIITEVRAILNAEHVRPITDEVIVKAAKIRNYKIEATIFTDAGPDPNVVIKHARDKIDAFITSNHRVGRDIPLSGIYAALHVEGVQRVVLKNPVETIVINHSEAPYCSPDKDISVVHGGVER